MGETIDSDDSRQTDDNQPSEEEWYSVLRRRRGVYSRIAEAGTEAELDGVLRSLGQMGWQCQNRQ